MERMKQGMICGGNNQSHIMYVFLLMWFQIQIKEMHVFILAAYCNCICVEAEFGKTDSREFLRWHEIQDDFFCPSYSVMFFARSHAASGQELYTALPWTVVFPPC